MSGKSLALIALIIAALMLAQVSSAQDSLRDITPENPLIFYQLSGIGSVINTDSNFCKQLSQAPFWDVIYAELEIQSKVKNVHLAFKPGVSMMSRIFGEDIVFVMPKFQQIMEVSPLLMLRLRDTDDDLGEIISTSIEIGISNAAKASVEYGGYKIWTIPLPEGAPFGLSCAMIDDVFAVGLGDITLRKVIDLTNGLEGAVSIEQDREFSAIMDQFPLPENSKTGEHLVLYHADFASMVQFINAFYPIIQPNLPEEMGMMAGKAVKWLDLVTSASGTAYLTDEGIESQSYMTLNPDAAAQNFLKMIQVEPEALGSLAFVPEDALTYGATNLADLKLIWDMAYNAMSEMPEIAEQVDSHLEQMEQQLGISIEEDVLSWMGNEIAYISNEIGAEVSPDTTRITEKICLVVRITDEEKARSGLEKIFTILTNMSGGQLVIKTREYMGNLIYETGELPIPMTPGCALVDGYLLLSPSSEYIQNLIDCASGEAPGLDANPRFQAIRSHWPEKANSLGFFDANRYIEVILDSMKTAVEEESVPLNEMGLEVGFVSHLMNQTSELATILSYSIGASIDFTVKDGTGLKTRGFAQMRDLESVVPLSDPDETRIARTLFIANRFAESEMPDRAIDHYRQVLAMDENNGHALMGMANMLSMQGKETEAALYRARMGFVPEDVWYVIGPFENAGGDGIFREYPPEEGVQLDAEYEVVEDAITVRWEKLTDSNEDGYVDLQGIFDPNEWAVAYAYTEVIAEEAIEAQLRVGSDDQVKVWLNGNEVLTYETPRPAIPDQDIVPVKLNAGKNQLLVKVCNDQMDWGFYLRFTDTDGNTMYGLSYGE